MYLQHFGLREMPFSITPDTSFFFASRSYQEALNTLLICLRSGEGFLKITGEVGTGKTLLCRKLMASLAPDKFKVAYVLNPYLEPRSLLMLLAGELGISLPDEVSQHELLNALTLGLLDSARANMQVVVCLDEVQAMPIETLEALRLLSNLETQKRKLMQVVIFGQPELEDKLNHPSIRQLKQRIALRCQRLRSVRLRHPDIADEQCRPRQKRQPATCNVALVSATGFLTKLRCHDGANRNRQKTVRFPCGTNIGRITGRRPIPVVDSPCYQT